MARRDQSAKYRSHHSHGWRCCLPIQHAHNANTRQISFSVCAATPPFFSVPPPPPSSFISCTICCCCVVFLFPFSVFVSSHLQDKQSARLPQFGKTRRPNFQMALSSERQEKKRHKRKMGLEVVNTEDGGLRNLGHKKTAAAAIPLRQFSQCHKCHPCSNPSFSPKTEQ